MKKEITKGSEMWVFFREMFDNFSNYAEVEETDEWWKAAIAVWSDFGEKFNESTNGLSRRIAMAILDHYYKDQSKGRNNV